MIWYTTYVHRSILTQPWMEIGGKMNVVCEQTGCHAMVEFHCKVSKESLLGLLSCLGDGLW